MKTGTFLEGVSSGLADQWIANLLTPAFVFWVGGFLAVLDRLGLPWFRESLNALSEPQQIGLLIFALLLVTLSSFVMQRFDFGMLRLLEGYWPDWFSGWRDRCIRQWAKRRQMAKKQRQGLLKRQKYATLTSREQNQLDRLEIQRQHFPRNAQKLMPTRLGNILRAAEEAPLLRYGLDPVLCWPHLWLILPAQTRSDVSTARSDLNTAVRILLWGLLFTVWTFWAWWALPVGILTALIAYGWTLNAATIYADLLAATFAIHRFALYKALNWPLPTNQTEEKKLATQLNTYLARGYTPRNLHYHLPEA